MKRKRKKEEEDPVSRLKRSVTFGKSTTYEAERVETDESTNFINKENVGVRGSTRLAEKKVISEKDLSDGRRKRFRDIRKATKRPT